MRRALVILLVALVCTLLTGPLLRPLLDLAGLANPPRFKTIYSEWQHRLGDRSVPVLCRYESHWTRDGASLWVFGVRNGYDATSTPVRPPPGWATSLIEGDKLRAAEIVTFRYGLPCRCFSSEAWWIPGTAERFTHKWSFALRTSDYRVRIPLRPLWPGLVTNLAVYSAILSLPFALTAARRSLRRRRGLCPACAYDLRATPGGSPCPECGNIL